MPSDAAALNETCVRISTRAVDPSGAKSRMWRVGKTRLCVIAVLVLALPAPCVRGVLPFAAVAAAPFPLVRADFAAGVWGLGGGHGADASHTLSGEVDAECGCLLESSCTHGAVGVAAARGRRRLHRLAHERRQDDEREDDDVAFIRTMMFPGGGDSVMAERSAAARSTCVREGAARRGLSRGRLAARMARSNSTSGAGDSVLRTAGSSLSVIAKRSARSWAPDVTVSRAVRGMRDVKPVVLQRDGYKQGRFPSTSGDDLTMMSKLVIPRLMSPTAASSMRGELVCRLRGLQGRYEVAKGEKVLLLRKDQQDSEASSAAEEPVMVQLLSADGGPGHDGGATLGALHAPRAESPDHDVPASDSWLEDGNAQDKVLPPIVAALLRCVAEEGDRAMEDECEVVGTSKDVQRSAFHAQRRPKVTLADYAERMCKYGACSPGCLGLSLVYMDIFLRQTEGYRVTGLNVHRLLLSCVLVATKLWDDTHYNNAFWAKVGGVANAEINSLERHLLAKLDFALLVDRGQWDAYRAALLAWGAVLQHDAHDASSAATMAQQKLDAALSCSHLRKSRLFAWGREALASSSLRRAFSQCSEDSSAGVREAAAAATAACEAYAPEGPGSSNVLAAEESKVLEPAPEDILLAAQRQMTGGMRRGEVREVERSARQQLTGGVANVQDVASECARMSFFPSSAPANNVVQGRRSTVFCR